MPVKAEVPSQLLSRPFTLQEARDLRVPLDLLRPPRFATPHRGVRVPAGLPSGLLLDAVVASLVLPGSALLTEWTALRLLGLPTPYGRPDPVGQLQARVPTGLHRPRVRGIDCSWLREHDLLHLHGSAEVLDVLAAGVRGLRLQHPLSAWCDVAPGLPFDDGVALGDAVRRSWASQAQMEAAVALRSGRAGSRQLRRVVAAVRHQVDSPMETETRLLLVGAGLPEPLCGRWVRDATGRLWQVDMVWLGRRVVVEYDGDVHRVKGKAQWRLDASKRQLLREAGWNVVVVHGDDLSRTVAGARGRTVERVRRALGGQ